MGFSSPSHESLKSHKIPVQTNDGQGDCLKRRYLAEVGVRESTNRNDGPRVRAYLASCHLPEGYEWCAAFCQWVHQGCGLQGARSPWAPSWFPARRRLVWQGKPVAGKSVPQSGDVAGFYSAAQGRIAHVGFVHRWGERYVTSVEGNTGSPGGVYVRYRLRRAVYGVARWW